MQDVGGNRFSPSARDSKLLVVDTVPGTAMQDDGNIILFLLHPNKKLTTVFLHHGNFYLGKARK